MEQSERKPMLVLMGAGGVVTGAMNSQLASLAVSLGGSQTSKYMFVIVDLSVGTPRVKSVYSYDHIVLICSVLFHGPLISFC